MPNPRKLTISLAQMEFEFGQRERNFERVHAWVEEAAHRGSTVVLFPELWASGYDLENSQTYAQPLETGFFAHLSELAKTYQIAIGSSLLESQEEKIYNTFALFGNQGETLGLYRKIHLFRLLDEEKWLNAGKKLVTTDASWGKTGLGICYDLRFPEVFRTYALQGVRLVLIVAEWPARRIAHWQTLLQARAIENQYFIAAVNKVGRSQGAKLGGHSVILDPMGKAVVQGGSDEVLLTATIDLHQVEKIRRWMPVFDDRSPDAYERVKTWSP